MKIYSYDIFDTCLVRCCGTPDNLFFLLAQSVYGDNADYDVLKNFVHDRIEAERIAIERINGAEACLRDIYKVLETDFLLTNIDNILQKELEIEKQELVPVAYYVNEIKHIRENGGKIVFISDMYLPSVFLKNILKHYELFYEGDLLYVSCEHSASKSSGNLYKLIAEEQDFIFDNNWLHTGDNRHSDVTVPRNLGIKVRHSAFTKYNRYEKTYIDNSFYTPCKEECIQYAGILRSCRLSSSKLLFHEEMAIGMVAATYIPYITWLLTDAIKQGVNHLLFLARDGKIFKDIAENLIYDTNNIKLTYLYVSRKSLESLKINPNLFIKYLTQLGIANDDRCAFVDLGWSGSSRTKLNRLFAEQHIKVVTTYYFGFWGAGKPSYNIANGGNMKVFNYLFSNRDAKLPQLVIPMIFEHYFSMVCDGTTVGYIETEGNVRPIKAECENGDLHYLEEANTFSSTKVAKCVSCYPRLKAMLPFVYHCCGRRNWARLISYPTRQEIELLRNIQISEMGGKTVPLIVPINFLQRLQIILSDTVWGAAPCWKLASLYNSPLRPIYHNLYNYFAGSLLSLWLRRLLECIYNRIKK